MRLRVALCAGVFTTASITLIAHPSPPAVAQDIACAQLAPAAAPEVPQWIRQLRPFATGAGVRVAVIDTGVSPSSELDQIVPGSDLVDPAAPNPLFDCDAHGTIVAGIIAGTTLRAFNWGFYDSVLPVP